MDHQELHIIFGTGPVGTAVMEELLQRGKQVRMINRSGNMENLPEGVDLVAGDATDFNFSRKAAEGARVIYNCLNPPYHLWSQLFPKLQAGVVEAAASTGAKLVVMENLYMYGETHGKLITEDMPYAATTKKGKVSGADGTRPDGCS